MTDTTTGYPPPVERSQAEIEATVRKLEAEAAKAEAERVKVQFEADAAGLTFRKSQEEYDKDRAADEYNHTYRFNGEVNAQSVQKAMTKLTQWHRQDPNCDIEIIFDSPGGSVFDGFTLYDHIVWLRNKGHQVTTGMVGMAASMAGILMQAGDHRWAGSQAWYLIHRASFGAVGSTYEVEDRVKLIQRIEKRIIDIFVTNSDGKLTSQKIKRNWERKDWWLSPEESLELGLVDEVRGVQPF